jgi:hypothetical protein
MTTASHIEPNSSYHEKPARRAVTLGGGRVVESEADGSFAFDGMAEARYEPDPRFGRVMVMSSVAFSKYVDAQGSDVTATVRLQIKLAQGGDRRLKLWAKLTGSRDVDQLNTTSKAGSAALGVQYAW